MSFRPDDLAKLEAQSRATLAALREREQWAESDGAMRQPGGATGSTSVCVRVVGLAGIMSPGGNTFIGVNVQTIDANGVGELPPFDVYVNSIGDDPTRPGQVIFADLDPPVQAGSMIMISKARVWMGVEWIHDWFVEGGRAFGRFGCSS